MSTEYIERGPALETLMEVVYAELASDADNSRANYIIGAIENLPAADVVSAEAYKQLMWERDTAIAQLAEYGVGFGEKKKDVEPVVHEPCEFCGGEKTEYSDSAYGKFSILKDRLVGWCIAAEFSQCPPFADCAVKNMKLTHLRQIKHCPNCGRKLDMDERSDEK